MPTVMSVPTCQVSCRCQHANCDVGANMPTVMSVPTCQLSCRCQHVNNRHAYTHAHLHTRPNTSTRMSRHVSSTYVDTRAHTHTHMSTMYMPTHMHACMPAHMPTRMPTRMPTHMSTHTSTHMLGRVLLPVAGVVVLPGFDRPQIIEELRACHRHAAPWQRLVREDMRTHMAVHLYIDTCRHGLRRASPRTQPAG